MIKSLNLLDVSGTYYRSCSVKRGDKLLSVMAWIQDIKEGVYRETIEAYRRHLEANDLYVANQLKHSLPAFIPSAHCLNGRAEGEETGISLLYMADYDHLGKEIAEQKRDMLKCLKWVYAAHITPSYGLRVFVLVPPYVRKDFKKNLKAVLFMLDKILELEHDSQATNLLRLSFASYDPGAWCREMKDPDLDYFPMVETMVLLNTSNVPARADNEMPAEHSNDELSQIIDSYSDEAAAVQQPTGMKAEGMRDYTRTELDQLLNRFQEQHVFARGSRNNSFIALGFRAYYLRVSPKSLEDLIDITSTLFSDNEYKFRDISSRIRWGYNHGTTQIICKTKSTSDSFKGSSNATASNSGNFGNSAIYSNSEYGMNEQAEIQDNNDSVIEENCPCFPEEVYENLPDGFAELLTTAPTKRDKDLLFMSIITILSSVLPNLRIEVDDNEYSANMFFFCIGPAACGKSIAMKALRLLEGIEKMYAQRNAKAKKEYEIRVLKWENELKEANKAKRPINYDLMPGDKPQPITFLNTGATSRSKLIIDMDTNPNGACVATAELETLTNSLNADYGKHSAELRSIAMNEPVSSNYKTDGRLIKVDFPQLTILATCTPDQMASFIDDTQDGMQSRSLCMLMASSHEYRRGKKHSEHNWHLESIKAYNEASKKVTAMYQFLEKYPTYITIPDELREKSDDLFEYYNSRIYEERHDELKSIINRCLIHTARICSVFVAIRKYESGMTMREIQIAPEDMTIALGIMKVLLQHTCITTTMLLGSRKKANKLKAVFTREMLLKRLPETFTTKEFAEECRSKLNCKDSTIYTILSEWIEQGVVVKPKKGVYVKTGNPLPKVYKKRRA